MKPIGRSEIILLGTIVLFAAGFRLATLNRPFERDPEGCGAFYGLTSRNYFRFSLSQSHGLPVISMDPQAPAVFYANHPPTTPLLIAAVHLLTGYRGGYEPLPGEWQTRLPSALFTIGCVIVLYVLLRRRTNARTALLAPALFAAIPMTLYYGGQPDVINSQLVFFALLTIAAYERLADQPGWKPFAWLVLAFTGAGIMDWPAFYLVPVLGLHYVCTHRPRQWKWIIGFAFFSTLLFAGLYSHLAMGKESWLWMVSQVERRTGGATDAAEHFRLVQWLSHAIWGICVARHSVIVAALALAGIAMAAARRFSGPGERFLGLLVAWGIMHVLIGRQGVYMHEWWWWPVTPGLIIAAAMAMDRGLAMLESRSRVTPRAANTTVVIALLLFAGWNARAVVGEMNSPKRINKGGIEYSLAELGETIRQNVAPHQAALLAESDPSLGLWYYADRGVKRQVWDPDAFQKRLNDDIADFSFDAPGKFSHPTAAMIVPKSYTGDIAPLLAYLDARYEKRDTGKFLVYDLSTQKPAE